MRIAALLFTVALALTAGLPSAQAQEPTGTISGRILVGGVVDKHSAYAILVFAADIEQPINALHHVQDLIYVVQGEFTVSDLHDGEYLVILASTHKQPANPEETVEVEVPEDLFPRAPRISTRAAVRVTVENGRADKEAVFELESGFSNIGSAGQGDFPSTGVAAATANRLPTHLAPTVAGLGVLLLAAGGFALRLRRRESDD